MNTLRKVISKAENLVNQLVIARTQLKQRPLIGVHMFKIVSIPRSSIKLSREKEF